jgi:hypothetical protein
VNELRSVQSLQPRPHGPANPIELAAVNNTWNVAAGVVAGVRDAAESHGGNACLCV